MNRFPDLGHLPALAFLAALAGYFLGAVPFGYLVARARGINIFEHGSKSPGATNVRRVLGKRAGNLVFVLDLLKGAVAGGWPLIYAWRVSLAGGTLEGAKLYGAIGMAFALLGHAFSCFTRFKGGKGVATGAGGFFVLMPPVTLIAAAVWTLAYFASRYVSLASILSAATIPLAAVLFREPSFLVLMGIAVAVFVIGRHRENIKRLLQGRESKWSKPTGGEP